MSLDAERRRHARSALVDPEDPGAHLRHSTTEARLGNAPLDPLATIDAWRAASADVKAMTVLYVRDRLGPRFDGPTFRAWFNTVEAGFAAREGSLSLATFKHKESGIELTLIPGHRFRHGPGCLEGTEICADDAPTCPGCGARDIPSVAPLLVGRSPLTWGQWRALTGRHIDEDRARYPVTGIEPYMIRSGIGYPDIFRLPTIRESLYAAHGISRIPSFPPADSHLRRNAFPAFWCADNSGLWCPDCRHVMNTHAIRSDFDGACSECDCPRRGSWPNSPMLHAPDEHDETRKVGVVEARTASEILGRYGQRRPLRPIQERLEESLAAMGCDPGRYHRGGGSPECRRNLHHHHDDECPPTPGLWNQFGLVDTMGNVHEMTAESKDRIADFANAHGCYRQSGRDINAAAICLYAGAGNLDCVGVRVFADIP